MIWYSGVMVALIAMAVVPYFTIGLISVYFLGLSVETSAIVSLIATFVLYALWGIKIFLFPSKDYVDKVIDKKIEELNKQESLNKIENIQLSEEDIRKRRIDAKKKKSGFTGTESKNALTWQERQRAVINGLEYFQWDKTNSDVEKLLDSYMNLHGVKWTQEDEDIVRNVSYSIEDILKIYSV